MDYECKRKLAKGILWFWVSIFALFILSMVGYGIYEVYIAHGLWGVCKIGGVVFLILGGIISLIWATETIFQC